MEIRAAEISSILKEQIKNFGAEAEVSEVGQVLSVGDGIARVYGLTNVMAWLLLQKAVIAGEMTAEQAAADPAAAMDFAIDDGKPDDPAAQARLPIAARGLLDRGRRLIAHVTALSGG